MVEEFLSQLRQPTPQILPAKREALKPGHPSVLILYAEYIVVPGLLEGTN